MRKSVKATKDGELELADVPYQQAAMDVLTHWLSTSMNDEDRKARANKRMSITLFREYLDPKFFDVADEDLSQQEQLDSSVFQGYWR